MNSLLKVSIVGRYLKIAWRENYMSLSFLFFHAPAAMGIFHRFLFFLTFLSAVRKDTWRKIRWEIDSLPTLLENECRNCVTVWNNLDSYEDFKSLTSKWFSTSNSVLLSFYFLSNSIVCFVNEIFPIGNCLLSVLKSLSDSFLP